MAEFCSASRDGYPQVVGADSDRLLFYRLLGFAGGFLQHER